MRDFINSVKIPCANFDNHQALVGMYDEIECRIEDGSRVGLSDHLILLINLRQARLDPVKALKLNGDFNLILDGYIMIINESDYFLVRSCSVPSHINQLHDYISETVRVSRDLIRETFV
ncbi:hypothetical protein NUF46_004276 [Yersinia enterocolitica]|nr:hypothetical protein [Yersinia enterocolitica]MBW5812551.1 hypothetical protein [Yersinia kristensenii]MBW5817929.1 hypothetical protein [Yersinia kristensenii]MBW5829852.1 hypothetical protein [Yersinia kristensenii]MBW5842245.1 hypothetical protein [Yersinia kristensenii]